MQPDQVLSCETVELVYCSRFPVPFIGCPSTYSTYIYAVKLVAASFSDTYVLVLPVSLQTDVLHCSIYMHLFLYLYKVHKSRVDLYTYQSNIEQSSLVESRVEQSTPSYLCSLYIYTLSHLKYFLLTLHHMHIYKYIFLRMVLKLSLEYLFVLYIRISYLSYTYT